MRDKKTLVNVIRTSPVAPGKVGEALLAAAAKA